MTETPLASGPLRVDRDRALQVLRLHQLEDARDFLLPWMRLAAASQATAVELYSRLRGLEARFDGRPIPASRLADPYECLFGESERCPELVSGLLGALRLRPRLVTIRSGSARLTIDRYERQTMGEEPEASATSLVVSWSGWFPRALTRECLRRARAARRGIPIPLLIDGKAA